MTRKITVEKLIEKIEGEATLKFHYKEDVIDFVDILFTSTRGIEKILEGRAAEDALVINPRVCGICGHAHLIATVQALEACYENLTLSPKAKIIRDLTRHFELIQNHFKWFYLTLLPLHTGHQEVAKAAHISRLMSQAIAFLAGQYPHNSYAITGGVTCDPTPVEILQIDHLIAEAIRFFESEVVCADTQTLMGCERVERLLSAKGDLPALLNDLIHQKRHTEGRSFDRFIVFGEDSYFKRGKAIKTRIQPHIDERYLQISDNSDSFAKNVTYKHKYYEVGPLSRAMLLKTPLIKDAHRRYGDSLLSRIIARVCESIRLLHHTRVQLAKLDLSQPSWIAPEADIRQLSGSGTAAVEAARGSLIHQVSLKEGKIASYTMITPTQWNLSRGTPEEPGIAQKAMQGAENETFAEFIFKTFDVCSVCTTH